MRSLLLGLSLAAALAPPPKTPVRPVSDTCHGVTIVDPYRWLEDGRDPVVREWSKEQDARTRSWLASLPDAATVRARTRELLRGAPPQGFRLDGLAAVSLSKGGTESGDLSVYEVAEASADGAIQDFAATRDRLYVVEISGGPSRVRVLAGGRELPELPLLPVSTVREIRRTRAGAVLVQNESFLEPPVWLRFDETGAAPVRLPISTPASVDFSDAEVVRDFAVSKDGTKVPLSILRRKGTKLEGGTRRSHELGVRFRPGASSAKAAPRG